MKSINVLLVILLCSAGEFSFAVENHAAAVASRIKRMVESSKFKKNELSIWIGEAGGSSVFESNGAQLMVPASLSKVFTAGLVLETLAPEFKFKTQLLTSATQMKSILKGDVVLKGGGDPSFVSETMWFLVNEFTRTKIDTIEGNIVVDDTRFDNVRFSSERESVRVDRAYDAPVGAMSMNWNSVNVFVRPGEKVGDQASVVLDPECGYAKLINRTTTKKSGKNLQIERRLVDGADTIEVSGYIGLGEKEHTAYKNISNPDRWSGINLKCFLAQRNIKVTGDVVLGRAPENARVLATAESRPLIGSLSDMLKVSNNYVAEMLIKNLAAEKGAAPATLAKGMELFKAYFQEHGFKPGSYQFVNPSGFNRDNQLSSQQIGLFLDSLRSKFSVFPEFLAALPIAGVDGTLKNRMKDGNARGWVRAKTGLLNGVVGLAGYAGHPQGHIFTFSFIYNGSGREDKARDFFDRLATTLVEE